MDWFRALSRRLVFSVAAIAIAAFRIPSALSAQVSVASDAISRHAISVLANHEIVFTSPSGFDASTDTLSLSFPGFTFGAVGFGDVDLSYGAVTGFENPLSLAASSAAGVWGVSVSGTSLVFTAPTDAGLGTVPAGSKVAIRIGTNASGGVNRLTNPASATVAQVTIGGTFGDSGTIGVPIVGNDGVSVTATVGAATSSPPNPGGGNGGGGVGGGVTAPAITNVQAINLTPTSVTISWSTDKLSDSVVDYGLTVAYASGTVSDAATVLAHGVSLSGLSPATTYHFRVKSFDPATQLGAASMDYVFTTPADNAAPVISNVQVVAISDTSAAVTWSTDEPASSIVFYGLTPAYGSQASVPGLATNRTVSLLGLSKNTTYHFQVRSADAQGLLATSADATFTTTGDVTPPANVGLSALPGDASVALSWSIPNDPDYAGVRILRRADGFPTGPSDGVLVYQGGAVSANDAGLVNGQTYYYSAFAYDADGNFSSGSLASTAPVSAPPVVPVVPPNVLPPPPGQAQVSPPSSGAAQSPPSVAAGGVSPALPGDPIVPPGTVPGSPPTSPSVSPVPLSVFYRGVGGVELGTDAQGRIGVLAGSSVSIIVPVVGSGTALESVVAQVGETRYLLALDPSGTFFSASVQIAEPGLVPVRVEGFVSGSGDIRTSSGVFFVQGRGKIVQATPVGTGEEGVPEATLQLYRDEDGAWVPYGPKTASGVGGDFGFVVPNGRYYVEISKPGFETLRSDPRSVESQVFGGRISLIRIPDPFPTSTQVLEQPGEAVRALGGQIAYRILKVQEALDRPEVRQTSEIARDVAVIASVVGLSGSSFGILALLQWLFTQPILLFGRRRSASWGTVYNVLSRRPVDLAVVRLVRADTGVVVQTRVTDRDGRYAFRSPKGIYRIEVVKPGFVFPSVLLKDAAEDGEYTDLYHGDPIEAVVDGAFIAPNIAGDPVVLDRGVRRTLARHYLRKAQSSIAVLGVVFSGAVAVAYPSTFNAGLFALQLVVLLLFRRLAAPRPPKPWGLVRTRSHRPVGGAIVRIFEKRFNKLLEMQVTGRSGDFGFFVGKNTYYLTAQKSGFAMETSKDILVADDRVPIEGQDVVLKKDQDIPKSPQDIHKK